MAAIHQRRLLTGAAAAALLVLGIGVGAASSSEPPVGLIVPVAAVPETIEVPRTVEVVRTTTATVRAKVTEPPPVTTTVTEPPVTSVETSVVTVFETSVQTVEVTLTTTLAAAAVQPAAKVPTSVYYDNCTAAKAAGAAPIHRGEPGYRSGLDRDNDGVACE